MRIPLILTCLIPAAVWPVQAQDIEAWEFEDLKTSSDTLLQAVPSLAHGLIGFYRSHIATHSVSRCPFSTSCSYFADEAIRRHGLLLGIAHFIDRNQYRENPGVSLYYSIRRTPEGKIKYDDSPYLGR